MTALVLGIVALVFAWIPFVNYAAIGIAVLGLVFGIIGLILKNRRKGTAVTGTILSGVGLIFAIIATVLYAAIFFGVSAAVSDLNKPVTVQYSVTGTASGPSIIWFSGSGSETANDAKLPWSKSVTGKKSDLGFVNLTATADQNGGTIECKITIAGKVVSDNKGSGAFASASCDASSYDAGN